MPSYDFKCPRCNKVVEKLLSINFEGEVECPNCGAMVDVGDDIKDGEMLDCHNCGVGLELWENELMEV